MRQVGWAAGLATGLGALAILATAAALEPARACTGENGCDNRIDVLTQNQNAAEETAYETEASAPLAIHPRKPAARKAAQPTRRTTTQASRKAVVEQKAVRTDTQDVPQSVKDANAEVRDDDTAGDPANGVQIVGADEVNEIDAQAAASESAPASAQQTAATPDTVPTTPAATPVRPEGPYLAMARVETTEQAESASPADSAWGSTSTIGKIFIALGGFLTAASAIRMFVG